MDGGVYVTFITFACFLSPWTVDWNGLSVSVYIACDIFPILVVEKSCTQKKKKKDLLQKITMALPL